MDEQGRRRPADVLRGLIPWIAPLPADPTGRPIVLEGEHITSILPYDRPTDFLCRVRISPDGKIAEGTHIVDAARCQGHRFGTPLLPGSTLGDLLYLTFGVLLRHRTLLPPTMLEGKIGVRARDEDFRYRRRVSPAPRSRSASNCWGGAAICWPRTAGLPRWGRPSSRRAAAGSACSRRNRVRGSLAKSEDALPSPAPQEKGPARR